MASDKTPHPFPFSKQQKRHNEIIIMEGVELSIDEQIKNLPAEARLAELRRVYELRSKGRLAKLETAATAAFSDPQPGKSYGRALGIFVWETDTTEYDKWTKRQEAHSERTAKARAELDDILNNPARDDGVLSEKNQQAMRSNMMKEAAQDERIAQAIKEDLSAELKAFSDGVGRPVDSETYVHRPAPNGAWRSSERLKPH